MGLRATRFRTLLAAAALAAPVVATGCDENEMSALASKIVCDLPAIEFDVDRQFIGEFGGERVDWLERVQSAGDGKTIVVGLLERNRRRRDQISDPVELTEFDRFAGQLAAGGGPRVLFQRDPAPDDLARLIANYYVTIVELGRKAVSLRGEPSLTYRLDPVSADRPSYVLTVSTRAGHEGFPLACQEYVREATGLRLTSEMRVTRLRWSAAKDLEAPPSPILARQSFDSLDAIRKQAGAHGVSLFLPKDFSLPAGFVLVKAEEVQMLTDANVARTVETVFLYRFVYSDGVEHIDVIEHAPPDTLPQNFVLGANGRGVDLAMIARFGSITSGSLFHAGTLITIESRIAADRFEAMLTALVGL